MGELTQKRRADRIKMVDMIIDVVKNNGGTYDQTSIGSRTVFLTLTFHRGLRASIELDGQSQLSNLFFVSWFVSSYSDVCLDSNTFPADVNNVHQRKATFITADFDNLLLHFDTVAKAAKEETIFDKEAEKLYVEKNGSWKDRMEKTEKMKKEWEESQNKA